MRAENHIMVDIETLGTSTNSVILSIAAVAFNLKTGEISGSFMVNVDIQSCLDTGLEISGRTLKFWIDKKPEELKKVTENAFVLEIALQKFYMFILQHSIGIKPYIWSRSPVFDLTILENAIRKGGCKEEDNMGSVKFWDMRMELDVRTIEALSPEVKKEADDHRTDDKHDPLADCLHQILYVWKICKQLKLV